MAAAALTYGAFMHVRNRASHPGTHLEEIEALEQLAVLSTIARILERCDLQRAG